MKNEDKKRSIVIKVIFCMVIMIITMLIIVIIYNQPKWLVPYKEDIANMDINKVYQDYMGNQRGSTVSNLLSMVEAFDEVRSWLKEMLI